MLVLTRKHQEQIRVGDKITLTILRIKGNSVRIGIEAPREVRVVRGELPPEPPSGEQVPTTPKPSGGTTIISLQEALREKGQQRDAS